VSPQPSDPKGWTSAGDIARRIQRMTLMVRGEGQSLMHLRPAPRPEPSGPGQDRARAGQEQNSDGPQGWWVVAQGRKLDPENFPSREAAREDLLAAVRKCGVLVPENVWVWDETSRAQLVLATLPTLERAQRVAERLRQKGLSVAVRRAMP